MTGKGKHVLAYTTFLLLLLNLFLGFLKLVESPDTFWHLATGKWIVTQRQLPDEDPFTFTSQPERLTPVERQSKRTGFILKQYWLAQVLFYRTFLFGGYKGVLFFTAALITLALAILCLWTRREGLSWPFALFIAAVVGVYLSGFPYTRPKVFSLFFGIIIVVLLEDFLRRLNDPARRITLPCLLIPLVMITWSNLHGGYLFGEVVIVIYVTAEGIKTLFFKKGLLEDTVLEKRQYLLFLAVGAAGILAGGLNPNGFNVVPVVWESLTSAYQGAIMEQQPPWLMAWKYSVYHPVYWATMVLAVTVFIVSLKNLGLRRVILFSFLVVISLMASRHTVFMVTVGLLIVAAPLQRNLDDFFKRYRTPRSFKGIPVFLLLLAFVFAYRGYRLWQNLYLPALDTRYYPEQAVRFLRENEIRGNALTEYEWGGYLIWRLYPDIRVFHDGRGLVERIFFEANEMMFARVAHPLSPNQPRWQMLINDYKIDIIVLRGIHLVTGLMTPLVAKLVNDTDWILAYRDSFSMVFLRRQRYPQMVGKAITPKKEAYKSVIIQARALSKTRPSLIGTWLSLGDAYLALNNKTAALKSFRKALDLEPKGVEIKKAIHYIEHELRDDKPIGHGPAANRSPAINDNH